MPFIINITDAAISIAVTTGVSMVDSKLNKMGKHLQVFLVNNFLHKTARRNLHK